MFICKQDAKLIKQTLEWEKRITPCVLEKQQKTCVQRGGVLICNFSNSSLICLSWVSFLCQFPVSASAQATPFFELATASQWTLLVRSLTKSRTNKDPVSHQTALDNIKGAEYQFAYSKSLFATGDVAVEPEEQVLTRPKRVFFKSYPYEK